MRPPATEEGGVPLAEQGLDANAELEKINAEKQKALDLRKQLYKEMTDAQKRDRGFSETGFAEGSVAEQLDRLEHERATRAGEISKLASKNIIPDAKGATDELNKEFNLRKKILELQKEQQNAQLALRDTLAEIAAPELKNAGVTADDTDLHSKAIDRARAEREVAQAKVDRLQTAGADSREAETELKEKQAAFLEIAKAAREELKTAEAQSGVLALQVRHMDHLAALAGIRAQADAQAAAALAAGKTEMVEQIRLQERIATLAEKAREFRKTPEQRKAEFDEQATQGIAVRSVQDQEKLARRRELERDSKLSPGAVERQINQEFPERGPGSSDYTGAKESPFNRDPDRDLTAATTPTGYDLGPRLRDPGADAEAHGDALRSLSDVATADPQADAGESDMGDVVGAVESGCADIVSAIGELSFASEE